jgi:hypothetical protein
MQALGIPVPEHNVVTRTFSPDPAVHPVYAGGFQQFQRIYQLLKEEFI